MIRRPPRSTLFPYRRSSDLREDGTADSFVVRRHATPDRRHARRPRHARRRSAGHRRALLHVPGDGWLRSEEHTSELQSLTNLVCRLLLEKKKKYKNNNQIKK